MRMLFESRLIRGTLVQRYKRFLADVRLPNGDIVTAHCTNTGSMLGCKEPGSIVYLSLSPNKGRKLAYTWEMIQLKRTWIGINTLHPNRLVADAIEAGAIPELRGYEVIRREVKVSAHSRQFLIVDLNQRQRFFRARQVDRGHGGDRLADITHFIHGDHRPAVVNRVDVGDIRRRQHRHDAGQILRLLGINGKNSRMRV